MTAVADKYTSYAELARHETLGQDYRIAVREARGSEVLIVAPHGGMIEFGTSELARAIAGDEHNVFSFEGLKPYGCNRSLHITSHRFDHPLCLAMAARCRVVLGIHGCMGDSHIHLGGLDVNLTARLAYELVRAGFPVDAASRRYPGRHPQNICNRGFNQKGAQLEVTYDLRARSSVALIAAAARAAIDREIECRGT
jgi:phage replication-related protein YjqB (UPF0714/DUF867 family)